MALFQVFQQRNPIGNIHDGYESVLKPLFKMEKPDAQTAINHARYREPFRSAQGMGFFPIVEELKS